MNLLSNPGIQDDLDILVKKKNNIKIKKTKKLVQEEPKSYNQYRNIVICVTIALVLFFSYSLYLSSYNLFTNKVEFAMLDVFNDIKNDNINSIHFLNNRLEIVLDYDKSNKIYKDYDLYDSKYTYVGLLINDKVSQIYIKNRYNVGSNVDFYELFSIISYIDDINIEKDIINNNLIIVGDYSDIINIFKALYNYSFNFKLDLMKTTSFKKYYKLIIFND